jgi:N-acetyl-anhydromuramyl-L-alanine amidase AmpD
MQKILSPHFTRAVNRPIDLVVIHTMEMDEKGSTAEDCARWFRNPEARVSAHYCVDNNSEVQCVLEEDVAWCAPGANHNGIHIEHAGRARQTREDWRDPYSQTMLDRSAIMCADICRRHKIPLTFLLAPDLVAQRRGITTHWQVSRAFGLSSHWDPGLNFPIEDYVADVKKILGSVNGPDVKDSSQYPTLEVGAVGWKVAQAQRLLNHAHQKIPEDGKFGKWMHRGVVAFQRHVGLNPTGAIGKATWRALWAHRYLEGPERPGHG